MRNWRKKPSGLQFVNVLLLDQFSNHCLANAVEPLRAANDFLREPAYQWAYLSLDGGPVTSSGGLPVQAADSLSQAGPADFLFVISSYGYAEQASPACLRALRAAAARHTTLVGLDTGSWLLAAAGLLNGHRATIHWDEAEAFREAFPEVETTRDRLVMEGNRWTCGGAMTAFDLALRMIARAHGEALRLDVAALFMAGESAAPSQGHPLPRQGVVAAALALMRDNLEDPLSIPQVAAALGITVRRLEAQFRADADATPQRAYRRLRLAAAHRLVEHTGLSVREVALRCGYDDPSAMTRAFREEFGTTPRALRRG